MRHHKTLNLLILSSGLAGFGCASAGVETAARTEVRQPATTAVSLPKQTYSTPDAADLLHTIDECEGYVRQQRGFSRPIGSYQRDLQRAMDSIADLDIVPIPTLGVGSIFEDRVRKLSLTYLTAARAHRDLGRLAHSERAAENAWEVARFRSLSPAWTAEQNVACFEVLEHCYEERGDVGKAMIAQLYQHLSGDYLQSERAIEDRAADREMEASGRELLAECDRVVAEAESIKAEKSRGKFAVALTMIGSAASAYADQKAITNATVANGGFGAEVAHLQSIAAQNQVRWMGLLETSLDHLDSIDTTIQGIDPMRDRTVVLQLVDRKAGVDPHGIYADFTEQVKASTEDALVQEASDAIRMQIEELREVWENTDLELLADEDRAEVTNEAEAFAQEFSEYLDVVREI